MPYTDHVLVHVTGYHREDATEVDSDDCYVKIQEYQLTPLRGVTGNAVNVSLVPFTMIYY